jgi:hypothetical protein
MKIQDLTIGQILKDGDYEVKVVFVRKDAFDVQYISGSVWTYKQEDLDCEVLETYIY